MYYVYAIKSISVNWVYVGITENIDRRFYEHNQGLVKSTKHNLPFELIFVQIVSNRIEARDLEKFLKVRWNKESLLNVIGI